MAPWRRRVRRCRRGTFPGAAPSPSRTLTERPMRSSLTEGLNLVWGRSKCVHQPEPRTAGRSISAPPARHMRPSACGSGRRRRERHLDVVLYDVDVDVDGGGGGRLFPGAGRVAVSDTEQAPWSSLTEGLNLVGALQMRPQAGIAKSGQLHQRSTSAPYASTEPAGTHNGPLQQGAKGSWLVVGGPLLRRAGGDHCPGKAFGVRGRAGWRSCSAGSGGARGSPSRWPRPGRAGSRPGERSSVLRSWSWVRVRVAPSMRVACSGAAAEKLDAGIAFAHPERTLPTTTWRRTPVGADRWREGPTRGARHRRRGEYLDFSGEATRRPHFSWHDTPTRLFSLPYLSPSDS